MAVGVGVETNIVITITDIAWLSTTLNEPEVACQYHEIQ